jgi:hypothetical protein
LIFGSSAIYGKCQKEKKDRKERKEKKVFCIFVAVKRRKGKEGKELCLIFERVFGRFLQSTLFLLSEGAEGKEGNGFFSVSASAT